MLHKSFVVFVLVVSLAFATPALAAPSFEVSWWSPVVDWWVGWVEWMGLGPEDAASEAQPRIETVSGEAGSGFDPIGQPSQESSLLSPSYAEEDEESTTSQEANNSTPTLP